jgi:peptide deformylase
VTYPNEILRKPAERVDFPLSKEIVKLTKDMIDTVRASDGVGLAAPQVGKSVRLVVINLEKNGLPPFALYNPKITSKSFKKTEVEEGCLSLPEVFGMVKRPIKVTVEAQNAEGKKIKFTDNGWVARVAQHEIDHTNGVLIIDYIKKFTQGLEIVEKWKVQNPEAKIKKQGA